MSDEAVKLAPGYDWRISLRKGVLAGIKTLAGVAVMAVLQYLASPENAKALFGNYPALVAAAPLVAGLCAYLLNAWKHRD